MTRSILLAALLALALTACNKTEEAAPAVEVQVAPAAEVAPAVEAPAVEVAPATEAAPAVEIQVAPTEEAK